LEKGENIVFEVTMANVSHANNLEGRQKNSDLNNEDPSNKYSESYWSEVI
jgi:hypothetical protein